MSNTHRIQEADMIPKNPTKSGLILVAVLCALFSLLGQEPVMAARTDRPSVSDGILNDSAWTKALDALMSRYHELGEFNGAVLVVREGQTLVNKGYGYADLREKISNGPETKFLIGSISKQFTAVMILKLVEMGRLSLDSTLVEALPYYRKDTGTKVKIRQLLDHTSGIPSFTDFLQEGVHVCPSIKEFILKYCSRELDFEPGARFLYNNGGYVILGAVVEQLTGLSYKDALAQYVLAPLGMNSSGLGRLGMALPQAAKGYQRRGGQIVDAGPVDPLLAFSAGGLYTTTTDIALWEKIFHSDAVLSSESRALLSSAPANAYFCGQRFSRRPVGPDRAERDIVFHGGRIEGFNSLLLRIPQDRIFIVLLNNTDSTRLETMAAGLLDVVYGRSVGVPRRSLAEECRVAQKEKGIEAAIEHLRAICREEGVLTDPEPEELQLNRFGYELLGQKRLPDALAVFSFTVEQFPNSWNAYDSLAEAQAALGKNAEAIKNYGKSLELNPANKNALEQIQKMVLPLDAQEQPERRTPLELRGYASVGGLRLGLDDLNGSMNNQRYSQFSGAFVEKGGFGHILINKIILGGGGYALSRKDATRADTTAILSGGVGLFHVGYVFLSKGSLKSYAMVGIGGGSLSLQATEKSSADFEEVLADPKRGSLLTTGGFLLELAVGADFFVKTKTHRNGAGGLLFGVQAGYSLAPGWGKWTMPDLDTAGGPKLGLTGFYVRLFFGGSRRFS